MTSRPPRQPQKSTSFIVQLLTEVSVGKLLLLLIPTLMFGGCCFTISVGLVASLLVDDETPKAPPILNDTEKHDEVPEAKVLPVAGAKAIPVTDNDEKPLATAMVRVVVFDDTEQHPMDPKAEIWFRGAGSWWLSQDTGPRTLGPRDIGQLLEGDDALVFFPDGRGDGEERQRIVIPMKLTPELNPEGSVRDSVTIEVSDESVEVYGIPIKSAVGTLEVKVPRERY